MESDSTVAALASHIVDDRDIVSQFSPANPRQNAVIKAVYLALLSSGQTQSVSIQEGAQGVSPTLIVAEMQRDHKYSSRCYDAVHNARRALEQATAGSKTSALLSKRIQRDDRGGYSLRSSVACVPEDVEDRVCWDLFQRGSCPRGRSCQWYHPQEADIFRVKVIVRCAEETISSEGQLSTSLSEVRHTISLGDLL